MKIAESWLREWVDPDFDTGELAHRLTMLGHEVDDVSAYGDGLDDIVVAEVVGAEKHPNADKLTLCQVDDGQGTVDVVCGAPNVTLGMRAAFARPGVKLPNGMKLRKAKIRGVVSNGMLCSASELGLGDDSDGIIRLPDDAKVGTALTDLLVLPDGVIDLDLTPNRGDCFSVLGIARDLAALTADSLRSAEGPDPEPKADAVQSVELVHPEGCPRFAGRVVRGIDSAASTPLWMVERLQRAGLRSISPVVDITNYVMLELGQPLHAYDAQLIQGTIRPRPAKDNETVTLLDEREVELNAGTMIITDDSGPIGMAGIMGGLSTAVSTSTTDVFLEAAFWPPAIMARQARSYGMHTDASLRFERGVDPAGQARAINRATELLLEIAGGAAGPLQDQIVENLMPANAPVELRRQRIAQLLGVAIDDAEVVGILERLGMEITAIDGGWRVIPPSHRFDIEIEADLIEEIARIHGYDAIPEATAGSRAALAAVPESAIDPEQVARTLVARDYQEIVSYSFIDAGLDAAFSGQESELVLSNPISSEMSVMRASLWPGMVSTAAANAARQQDRVRLFEISKTFHGNLSAPIEVPRIAMLTLGDALPEQWGSRPRAVDFFDIKADIEALLLLAADKVEISFAPAEHPALQPGQSSEIARNGEAIGVLGKLHPRLAKRFDLKRAVYLAELDATKTLASNVPSASAVSKFPSIRRDIAVVVRDDVTAGQLEQVVRAAEPVLIKGVRIFDIYRGDRIEAGLKSVAIGLILQETSRTLTDEDADGAMAAVLANLKDQFAAVLRD